MDETRKFFVIDTNVLIHDPSAISTFHNADIVIPYIVLEELDDLKDDSRKAPIVRKHARDAIKYLLSVCNVADTSNQVQLNNNTRLKIELNHIKVPEIISLPHHRRKNDNRILSVAFNYRKEWHDAIIVTKDGSLSLKAAVLGIPTQDYEVDKVNWKTLYRGVIEIKVPYPQIIDEIHNKGSIEVIDLADYIDFNTLLPNQYIILKCEKQSALCRLNNGRIAKIKDQEAFGIKPLNKEQRFAMDLLLDDSIKVVTLIGRAGTGKTLMAIAAGLEKVIEQKKYRKLLVMRPTITTDDGIGFLPGTKEEKLRPFMAPIYDNLDYLFDGAEGKKDTIEMLFEHGTIEVEALSYVRGRSLTRSIIVLDEGQNTTPIMMKTILTRVGKGSKIIITGDPEQIDTPFLDEESNGLSYLVDQIKHHKITGHITLTKGERSEVAEIGATLN